MPSCKWWWINEIVINWFIKREAKKILILVTCPINAWSGVHPIAGDAVMLSNMQTYIKHKVNKKQGKLRGS